MEGQCIASEEEKKAKKKAASLRRQHEFLDRIKKDPVKWKEFKDRKKAWSLSRKGRIGMYKTEAARRKLEWAISDDFAWALLRTECHYCGLPPNPVTGIDRKDNKQGYMEANCLPCCPDCNYAKSGDTYADFMAWIDRIVKFRKDQ